MVKKILLLLFILCSSMNIGLFAQAVNATVRGVVIDENSVPIMGATILIENNATGYQTGTITNDQGEYILRQLPLGSNYDITASFIGYTTQTQSGFQFNQNSLIQADFTLSSSSVDINEVVVVARSFKDQTATLGAATKVSSNTLNTMPVNGRNFTSLTNLSPLASGSNLGGQIGTATSYSLDGMSATGSTSGNTANRGPYLVSMEAIREFEVVTNSYDVTQGRGGGGAISSVTKSGTNNLEGSAYSYHRADFLSSSYNANGNPNNNEYSTTQFGFSLGGPIIKDKLHFFVSLEQQLDARPLIIGDIQNVEDEKAYNISKETLDKFVEIARDQYGVSDHAQVGTFDKKRPSTTAFARFDWSISDKSHLTLSNNFNRDINVLGVGDYGSINLYEVYGTHASIDNSVMATLHTVINPRMTNVLKAQQHWSLNDGRTSDEVPDGNIPRAIVENIQSEVDGSNVTIGNIQLGGQRYLPETFTDNVFQIVDNFYLETNNVSYTFGADLMYTHLKSLATSEMNGRFYYNGLEAFENNTPYRYAREVAVTDPTALQSVLNGALYAQAEIQVAKGFDATIGVRGDYTHYFQNPTENKVLQDALGMSTTNKLKALQIQPRVQLVWDVNDKHTDIIKIGAGIMGSNMNNFAMINNLQFDGNKIYTVDISDPAILEQIGADFPGYREDPSSAPGAELFDKYGLEKVATYNVNAADLKMPVVYKYSFSYNKYFNDDFRAGISFYGSNTRNNYMYVDRNMVDTPFFTLDNEGGRGVYVPASSITAKGETDWTQGRKSNDVARVLELVSEGSIDSYSFVADMSYRYFRDGYISASYTWNDTKDNTSYNGNVANTATFRKVIDDPRQMDYVSYSDNQFRHKLVVYGNTPSFCGINVGLCYSALGGTRYSLYTGGNTNGDFVSGNELAYVFDPNDPATPANIRDGINSILNDPETEEGFKEYLRSSFGKIAERNGGVNPFAGTLDVKVAKTFDMKKAGKIELSVDFFNFANLLNKKWGISRQYDGWNSVRLYNVEGFDHAKEEFIYNVNTNAGKAGYEGRPWQIQIGAKYKF